MRTKVHWSGSWFAQDQQRSLKEELQHLGCEILCDWTSEAHSSKKNEEQWMALRQAIADADICFFSFEGMEERTESATFAQFFMSTVFLEKLIVVYDPDKSTRKHRNYQDKPVHPAFNHMMGLPLWGRPNVVWTDNKEQALEAVKTLVQMNNQHELDF